MDFQETTEQLIPAKDTLLLSKSTELSPTDITLLTFEKSQDSTFKSVGRKSKYDIRNKSPPTKKKKNTDKKQTSDGNIVLSNRFQGLESSTEENFEINIKGQSKKLMDKHNTKINLEDMDFQETLENIKLIKAKDRTTLQQKRYHHLMYLSRKETLNEEQKEIKRKENAERNANKRAYKRETDDEGFRRTRAAEKSKERTSKRNANKEEFRKTTAAEKSQYRANKRSANVKEFKKAAAADKSKDRLYKRIADEEGFRKAMAVEKNKTRLNCMNDEEKRRKLFLDSIRSGRVFECVSCHRKLFENGVVCLTEKLKTEIEESFKTTFELAIGEIETRSILGSHYICLTCKMYTVKGKIPPMANKNQLQLFDISGHEELKLTELENCLIALNIIFQKVYQLPKSRWPAMKDRTVNIPVYESDVLKTVQSLPRTPSEAGIIPINLKRKLSYKQSHKTQYVSVDKILRALETLKNLGNRYYQFVPDFCQFKKKCKETDTDGFNFLFQEETENEEETINDENKNVVLEENIEINQEEGEELNKELNDNKDDDFINEEEYKRKDCVKKWQFDYNQSTCFSNNYPEINYKEDTSEEISVAPGEGKLPSNILEEKDWDLKSFPCLHPDGQNTLHSRRATKLDEQQYFNQRILNKDSRFAECPAYIFAAIAYIEKKQIEQNRGISFQRGKCEKGVDGTQTYTLNDPYSVLDNIKNTPRYWQKARYELIARLENLGPFTFFFTLSCADLRWPENFTALLQDHSIKYDYENGIETVKVNGILLEDFLRANESKHEFIKKNLLNATLTFHHRVKMFIKYIVMSKGNPMALKYNSYKVEFALRGAGHIHGVLWVDWNTFEALPNTDIDNIKEALKKIKHEKSISEEEKESITKFADLFISCSLKDPKTVEIVKLVNMHHHTMTCNKYGCDCRFYFPRFPSLKTIIAEPVHMKEPSSDKQNVLLLESKKILRKVKDILEDKEQMEKIYDVKLVEVNEYMWILSMIQKMEWLFKNNTGNKETTISVTDKDLLDQIFKYEEDQNSYDKEDKTRNESEKINYKKSQPKAHQIEIKIIKSLLNKLKIELLNKDIESILKARLVALLEKSGISGEDDDMKLKAYEQALGVSVHGYRIVHKRDVNEIYVNNYNPEWILNWNANMDLQLCLDFFAVITYISDYYGKDDSGTMKFIKEALKEAGNESLKTRLSLVAHQFLTHRQMVSVKPIFEFFPI